MWHLAPGECLCALMMGGTSSQQSANIERRETRRGRKRLVVDAKGTEAEGEEG
jgi:hypothetical protein